ncbi:MAG: cytochrome c family protein [Candidatus Omnitrophica bacterium]|nr:cytochrome c family protein [Candidatus Omnitrophota bacterium]
MKRYSILGFVLALVIAVVLAINGYIAVQAQSAPEKVTLSGGSFGAVTFNHSKHAETIGCKDCHHQGELDQKCNSCHTAEASVDSKTAFHKSCIDCHKEKEQGPTGCMDCHKKE